MEDGARLFICFGDKVDLDLDFKFTPAGLGNLEWWTFNGCLTVGQGREVSGLPKGPQAQGQAMDVLRTGLT